MIHKQMKNKMNWRITLSVQGITSVCKSSKCSIPLQFIWIEEYYCEIFLSRMEKCWICYCTVISIKSVKGYLGICLSGSIPAERLYFDCFSDLGIVRVMGVENGEMVLFCLFCWFMVSLGCRKRYWLPILSNFA